MKWTHLASSLAVLAATGSLLAGGELTVVSINPERHALHSPRDASIAVTFDQPVDAASVDGSSFHAFGRWSGPVAGSLAVSPDGLTVTLDPEDDFTAGERVTVFLSHDLRATGGSFLRSGGYSFQFWTAARPSTRSYTEVDTMTTRTVPNVSSRAYGGIGTDLNNDGWLDITTVNEDSADLRVFMNLGDGTGAYAPFTQPTFAVEDRASPSEPADFNLDGNADICVANINTQSVSILLGNGDGTFGPQQIVSVGSDPRGIAVLDLDGDGDVDIANTNATSSNVSIMLNDGAGVFGSPSFFNAGGSSEWSLDAGDMNEDGLLDLVVGARSSQLMIVQASDGDGTFTQLGTAATGSTWMIALGDVDGDGHLDVSSANSSQNQGGILIGDGAGNLAGGGNYASDPFPLATDLGDMDGDGDLDWIISGFSGDWYVYVNDGAGVFTFDQELLAPDAASCALIMDIDNDDDTDLVLIDELEDVVIILRNGDVTPGDIDQDGAVDVSDLLALLAEWGSCGICPEDVNQDGIVDVTDLLIVLGNWT